MLYASVLLEPMQTTASSFANAHKVTAAAKQRRNHRGPILAMFMFMFMYYPYTYYTLKMLVKIQKSPSAS